MSQDVQTLRNSVRRRSTFGMPTAPGHSWTPEESSTGKKVSECERGGRSERRGEGGSRWKWGGSTIMGRDVTASGKINTQL